MGMPTPCRLLLPGNESLTPPDASAMEKLQIYHTRASQIHPHCHETTGVRQKSHFQWAQQSRTQRNAVLSPPLVLESAPKEGGDVISGNTEDGGCDTAPSPST